MPASEEADAEDPTVDAFYSGLSSLTACRSLRLLALAHPVVESPRQWVLSESALLPLRELLNGLQVAKLRTLDFLSFTPSKAVKKVELSCK